MADGQTALFSGESYCAVGQETTLGTYSTCTAGLLFLSSSLRVNQEGKMLEEIAASRTYGHRVLLGRNTGGDIPFYVRPSHTATAYILQNAFGATITSASATGESVGGDAMSHTFAIGNLDRSSVPSLCVNMRKGDTSTGKEWQYSGLRVNEITFAAELDDALKCSPSFVGIDGTTVSNDVSAAITLTCTDVLNFTDARVSVEQTFGSLTSSSFWHVQSAEVSLANSVKSDADARRIGSAVPVVLPQGIATPAVTLNMRFDTTTAYDAMIGASALALELEFQSDTMAGSVIREGLKLQFPKVYVTGEPDPEIGGPDEVIKATINFHVARDCSSVSGYAMRAILTNLIQAY